jgi:acetylornithine deacetylase/succinyl-diaminopimelate desuccinylase-like protein
MRQMFETMAAVVPPPDNEPLLAFLDSGKADQALDALGAQGLMYDALLHNVANATIIRGGDKINVIPSEVEIEIDCRMLPGFTPVEAIAELQSIVGEEVAIELVRHDPGPAEPDMGLFDSLSEILKDADPTGVPVPYVVFGSTDGRHFTKLDIQTYGFLPMNLPADFDFLRYVHAADERIPVDAVGFGADAVYEVLRRFGN